MREFWKQGYPAAKHEGDDVAQAVAALERQEIELYREHGDWYGYVFFVGRLPR